MVLWNGGGLVEKSNTWVCYILYFSILRGRWRCPNLNIEVKSHDLSLTVILTSAKFNRRHATNLSILIS